MSAVENGADRIRCLPANIRDKAPDPEPSPPDGGFTTPVSYPFVAPGAKERVMKAISEGTISSATKVVREFEDELRAYFRVPLAKACNSGYSALVLALQLGRIGPGDDVLIPTLTMAAVANAVLTAKANPITVDCAKGEFNPSLAEYERQITPKTRALIVTHTYGVPADCPKLQIFCKRKGLIFIEDIAEAIGAECNGKPVGTFGDFACASLYANKAITAGDGGFVLSTRTDPDLFDRANSYANHGFTKDFHFVHFEPSGNYKMSGLQAALVTPAIALIPHVMEDRSRIAQVYRSELDGVAGLELMPMNPYGNDAPWVFAILVESKQMRTKVRQKLADERIETRDFFFPLHLQPFLHEVNPLRQLKSLPNSEDLGSRGFYLPTFYNLPDKEIKRISQCIKDALKKELINHCVRI